MTKKFKKYTFAEKRNYWKKVVDIEFEKKVKTNKTTNKFKYAIGFLISSKNGRLSSNFNNLERPEQLGQIAGFKAKVKNQNK